MLVDARRAEAPDDRVVQLDLHERLQIDVGDARGLLLDGEQQVEVLLVELRAANLPHALADGRLAVKLAVVVAEFALDVAFVRLADGAQPGAHQAGAAAAREAAALADVIGAALQRLEAGDFGHQLRVPVIDRRLDLGERRVNQLLLVRQNLLVLGQLREELKPHQRVLFGNLHRVPPVDMCISMIA